MEVKEEPIDDSTLEKKLQKTRLIIEKEFSREYIERENDIYHIQEQIQFTQKCIKVLKYVEACRLYQGDDVKNFNEPENGSSETALHPCVQWLLPNKSKVSKTVEREEDELEKKSVPPFEFSLKSEEKITLVRGTYKVRHCLIVGNVSKFIHPDIREDQATHKWMLYIRDKGRDEDLGTLVKKVRYFLHESYKPHDIIDVTTPPFHLTRRGWGEFVVRVMIFFQHPGNKTIDVVHPLKLDETCTGIETLGRETAVEVDLLHDNISDIISEKECKTQPVDHKKEIIAIEHDYCSSNKSKKTQGEISKPLLQPQQIVSTESDILSEEILLRQWNPSCGIDIVSWYRSNLLTRLSTIYFLNTEGCVKWFLTRWPIITPHASDSQYRTVFPYTFKSFNDYFSSSIVKRHASEWFRAYQIKSCIEKLNLQQWSTKQIFMYSRMHGYVIFLGNCYSTQSVPPLKNIYTYTNTIDIYRDLRLVEFALNDKIDVVETSPIKKNSPPKKIGLKYRVTSTLIRHVEIVSKEIGIRFGNEEIVPGVETNAATQILSHVLRTFIVELLRKSLANAWFCNSCKHPQSIEVSDVLKTIIETPEFDILTNSGLGSNK